MGLQEIKGDIFNYKNKSSTTIEITMKTRLQCQLDKNRILNNEISQLKHIVEFYNRNFSRIFEEQLMTYREFKTMEI